MTLTTVTRSHSPSFNIEVYFQRIGFAFSPEVPIKPDYETFLQITRRHAASIPFENIDAFLDAPVSVELDKLYDKMVLSQRGGYCLEQSALMCGVLLHLGYDAFMVLGRAYGPLREKVPVRTHCAVHVRFEDGSAYLVDVGGGGSTMTTPLQLRRAGSTSTDPYVDMCGVEQFTDNAKYMICRERFNRTDDTCDPHAPPPLVKPDGEPYNPPQCLHTDATLESLYQTYGMYSWQHVKQRWTLSYTFDLHRQSVSDVVVANYYAATASTFKLRCIASRIVERAKDESNATEKSEGTPSGPVDAECIITLMNNTFSRYTFSKEEQLESRTLSTAEEVYDVLKNEFKFNVDDPKYGISLERMNERSNLLFGSSGGPPIRI